MPPKKVAVKAAVKRAASPKPKAKAKAIAEDPKALADKEAEEQFLRWEPEGSADGAITLKEFADIIRAMNTKKCMLFGDEPQPIIKQEWTKVDGFKTKKLDLAGFKAWWPTFLDFVESKVAERDAAAAEQQRQAAAANAQKDAACSGDGIWKIPLKDLNYAIDKATQKGKTALILDNTEGKRVEAYLVYSNAWIIECKKMVMDTAPPTKKPVEEVLEEQRDKFFSAQCFKRGQLVVFRMANTATNLVKTFSNEVFPSAALLDRGEVATVLGMENADKFEKSPFGKMCPDRDETIELTTMGVHQDFRVVVVTHFEPDSYEEFLIDALPLNLLQPVQPYVD